jgi:hypothetical protein
MKTKLLFFICFFIPFFSEAQEVVLEKDSSATNILKVYELKDDKWNAWKIIEKNWKKEYSKVLKEQKIKLNCSDCSSVYLDAVLSIDETGKLKYYKLLNSKKCSEKFSKGLEIRFMKWFFNYKFPEQLYNLKFEVRLGNSLKC